MLVGEHSIAKMASSIDKVKTLFVNKMRTSSEVHSYNKTSTEDLISIERDDSNDLSFHESMFFHQGSALPERSTFRYSYKQKIILYDFFMDGHNSGKISPDEAHIRMTTMVFTFSLEQITERGKTFPSC